MRIQVGEASPPHRETRVAEFHLYEGATVSVPAEMYRSGDQKLMLALFNSTGGVGWELEVDEFLAAVESARRLLRG